MKKSCSILFILLACSQLVTAQPSNQPTRHPSQASQHSKDERMKWWREARFGMFIHWGVYAQ